MSDHTCRADSIGILLTVAGNPAELAHDHVAEQNQGSAPPLSCSGDSIGFLTFIQRDNPAELAHDHVVEIQLDFFLHVAKDSIGNFHTLSFTNTPTGDEADRPRESLRP